MPSPRPRLALLTYLILLATVGLPVSGSASVSEGLKIRWFGDRPRPVEAGREFVGQVEVIAGKPGRLENVEIAGEGWSLSALHGHSSGAMARGERRLVTFRAVPQDPTQPLAVRARFEGASVERPLRLDAVSLQKRRLRFANTAGPQISGARPMRTESTQDQQIAFSGEFRYTRGDGVVIGADHMTVKIWDDDSPDPDDELVWSGQTDANGHFEGAVSWDDCDVSGCDDPDLYVEVIATSPAVDVQTSDVLETTYSWESGITENFTGTFINFGVMTPGDAVEHGAAHIFSSVTRAHRFAAERAGMNAPLVDVQWPDFSSNVSNYNLFFEEIHIIPSDQWNEITQVHEFGHHLHNSFGNLLTPDYENGYCDPGHCYWCPEGVGEGWQEGVAYWYAMVVVEDYLSSYGQTPWSAANYTSIYGNDGLGVCSQVDNLPYPDGRTEGMVAALLRDMQDGANDDHDGDATFDCEVDAMSLGHDEILTVFRDDDPTDIGMFIGAFRARYPQHDMDLWSTTRNVGPTFSFPVPDPAVLTQPQACRIARAGETITFNVTGNGSLLKYQWRQNGLDVVDGAGVSGATTPTLTLSPLAASMGGIYVCVVTSCDGSRLAVSAGSRLTVEDAPAVPRPHLTWGENSGAQCGNGTNVVELPPGSYTGLTNVVQAEGGRSYSIALKADGTVYTWGRTEGGELGNGFHYSQVHSPQPIALSNVIQVAAGNSHALALLRNGAVMAWGWNLYGQLGNGTQDGPAVPTSTQFPGCIVAIAAGHVHTLALDADGRVWACGYNGLGALGNGGSASVNPAPTLVPDLTGVVAIRAAGYSSFALKADGTVWSWGYNPSGQLGHGTFTQASTPVQISGLTSIRAIAASTDNGYAIRSTGEVYAWGRGDLGMIGNGSGAWQLSPVVIPDLVNPVDLEAGDGNWVLALMQDGTLKAWGYNANTVLATGAPNGTYRYSPEPVLGVSGVNGIGVGWSTAHVFGNLGTTAVDPTIEGAPLTLALRVAPVPSRSSTSFSFDLPTSGLVSLAVYDVAGKRVQTIANAWHPAGRHSARWDGRLPHGGDAPAGVYFARLERGGETLKRRIVLVR